VAVKGKKMGSFAFWLQRKDQGSREEYKKKRRDAMKIIA
jgi:hypothetical protein